MAAVDALATQQLPLDALFRFHVGIRSAEGAARLGMLHTPHGTIETPAFLPVGTQGTVKGLHPSEVWETGARMILANTYHLWLRPGEASIATAGGLHRWMAWPGAILTDSGGFQVFSLRGLRSVQEDGVHFRSHLDGSQRFLSPEGAMQIQEALGGDITMVLDECSPHGASVEELEAAVDRTTRWAERAIGARRRSDQALFGIVQGGTDLRLRRRSARSLLALGFSGYAIGSLSVGEPLREMRMVLEETVPWLPADRPRYLMGVGSPDYLLEAVWYGIDLFDCVLPTRVARNGTALVLPHPLVGVEDGSPLARGERPGGGYLPEGYAGRLVVKNAAYAHDLRPLDPGCACATCRSFDRSYLRHLCATGEMLGPRLISVHNLHTLARFVGVLRDQIRSGTLGEFRREFWRLARPWSARNRSATEALP